MTAARGSDVERHGISITGQGVRFDLDWNAPATARSDLASDDPFAAAIAIAGDMELLAVASVSRLHLTGAGSRGGDGEGSLTIELGRPGPDEGRVALIEENGSYTWTIPEAGDSQVRVPVEAVPGTRDYLPKAVRRVIRVIAVRTVGRVVEGLTSSIAGAWDARRHPPRLRPWTPLDHRDADPAPFDPSMLGKDAGEPVLLVVHGFTGSTHSSFSFDPAVVKGLCDAYHGRTMAFDHPTLARSPAENVEWLQKKSPLKDLDRDVTVDVLAYSRGGLVARCLAEAESRLRVRSITFVATPNAGTPLCDPARPKGLLDALTNLAGAIPGSDVVQLVLELVRDVALGSVLRGLRGLSAMQPGDADLAALNGRLPARVALRAICADYEPTTDAGLVRTARDRAVDWYFGGVRNDLIVPTLSTVVTQGLFGVRPGDRLVLDSSRAVDHSGFWSDQRTIRQLQDWLRPDWPVRVPAAVPVDETDPFAETATPPDPLTVAKIIEAVGALPARARKAAEELVGGPLDHKATPPTGKRDAVVVVPGIMGTHLARTDGGIVWLDPVRLARGHFADMAVTEGAAGGFTPAGLNRCYLPLITQLAKEYDVYVAPFDWRLDIRASAEELARIIRDDVLALAPGRKVQLVAHSMGGLVARAMAVYHPDLWDELAKPGNSSGRLVMLGTPHHGSFSIVLTLLGEEAILKVLDAVDRTSSMDDLRRVVASFPGVYQMLPHKGYDCGGDRHDELFSVATWGPHTAIRQPLLDDAMRFHEDLAGAVDPERMICVAGYGHPTPYRVSIKERGAFSLGVSARGDGRVAEPLGHLPGVPTYFTPASHGGLPSAPDVLEAIGQLLADGETARLPRQAPVSRGVDAMEAPPMVPAELFDEVPAASALRGYAGGDGGQGSWRTVEARLEEGLMPLVAGGRRRLARVVIPVRVVHASLEQATYPVAVGHYSGLPQGGAERFLDSRLGGALQARQALGLYPESEGTAIFIPAPPGHRPRGALVLGLGDFGALTPATLTEAMCNAVVTYALADREARNVDEDPVRSLGVSAVLVSTPGRHGLSVESTVVALVEGVIAAAGRLQKASPTLRLDRITLELIDLYEQPAEEAALAVANLPKLLDPRLFRDAEVIAAARLEIGDGRRRGSPPQELTGTPWVPVRVELKPADASTAMRRMLFSPLSRRAQANAIEHDVDLVTIDEYISEAIHRPDADHTFSRTLYEWLFPHRAKLDFDRSEAIHLLVDDDVAHIPWELLATESAAGCVTPLALRAGMLRQLVSTRETRERWRQPAGQEALIIGDPPTSMPRLPGAREEARELRNLFSAHDWDVVPLVYGSEHDGGAGEWMDILNHLYARPYRLVHIAAHGVIDDDDARTGVQIGRADHHRLTSLSFASMAVTPDLVFLNCCHLGQLSPAERTPGLEQPNRVASTVARRLLRNGTPAVVVTGWAVDDVAARAFATTLYQSMLEGMPFGEAVRRARIGARNADNGATTTWGAYQCYGDPDFQFFAHQPPAPRPQIVSAAQLARLFDLVAARAGNVMSDAYRARRLAEVDDLVRQAKVDLLVDGAVLESLGHAYAELGEYQRAIDAYRRSLNDEEGASRVRAAARLANCQARLATKLHHDPEDPRPDEAVQLFAQATETLRRIERLCGKTAEVHALRGSLEKKRATTLEEDAVAAAMRRARVAYCKAWEISSQGRSVLNPYHTNLRLQLAYLAAGAVCPEEQQLFDLLFQQAQRELDKPTVGYWEIARLADTLVTRAVLGLGDLEEVRREYLKAFRLRSTVRQRDSAIDHLLDLSRLVPVKQRNSYRELVRDLRDASARPGP